MTVESAEFWADCPLISVNPEVKHGAPVFRGTRLEAETVIGSVDAYMEIDGLPEDAAIAATLQDHRSAPGVEAVRQVLVYFDAHQLQLQP